MPDIVFHKISWREAIKRFRVLNCVGCGKEDDAAPLWFIDNRWGPYCKRCVVAMKSGQDLTASRTEFFKDTLGRSRNERGDSTY